MHSTSRAVAGLISLLAVIGLGAAAYYGLRFALDLFGVMDRQTAAILAVVVMTALLGARIIAGGLREHRSSQALCSERLRLYQKLIGEWLRIIDSGQGAVGLDALPASGELERQIVLIAGPRVIRQYRAMRNTSTEELPASLDRLVREMRKELGMHSVGLSREHISGKADRRE